MCNQLLGRNNGESFQNFVVDTFTTVLHRVGKGNTILQDCCPFQNSAAARAGFNQAEVDVFNIPPRSPDLNPIENVFNNVRKDLHRQAIDQNIRKETYQLVCTFLRPLPHV